MHFRKSPWIAAIAALLAAACALPPRAGAEARLYFSRIDLSFMRITEADGVMVGCEPVAGFEPLYKFPFGERQPPRVVRFDDEVAVVVQDVKGLGVHGWGPENDGKEWVLATAYRKSRGSDGYDAVWLPDFNRFPPHAELEELLRQPRLPKGFVLLDALLAVPGECAMEAVRLAPSDPLAALVAIEECRSVVGQDDLFLLAMEFEAAALAGDALRIERLLSRWESRLRSCGNAAYIAIPDFYADWLKGHAAHTAGRNALPRWETLLELTKGMTLDDALRELHQAELTDACFNPRYTLIVNWQGILKQPVLNTSPVRCLTWASVFGDLFAGNNARALETTRAVSTTATRMSSEAGDLMTHLIGTALGRHGAQMWRWVALDAAPDAEAVRAALEKLRPIVEANREGMRTAHAFRTVIPGGVPDATSRHNNFLEPRTRTKVTHTELTLVHAAAVARVHLMETGEFPESPWHLYDLLGELSGDPFQDWAEPLRYFPLADRAIVYSLGPDGKDQSGLVLYDPTNGTTSGGDIVEELPRRNPHGFPLPLGPKLSGADIEQRFPKGFGDGAGWVWKVGYVNAEPASVFCTGPIWGPPYRAVPQAAPPPTGHATIAHVGSYYDLGPAAQLTEYDPTNGTFTEGYIYLIRDGMAVK